MEQMKLIADKSSETRFGVNLPLIEGYETNLAQLDKNPKSIANKEKLLLLFRLRALRFVLLFAASMFDGNLLTRHEQIDINFELQKESFSLLLMAPFSDEDALRAMRADVLLPSILFEQRSDVE